MTREEAINDLKDFIDIYLTCHGEKDTVAVSLDNVDVEAFHMAIKALEQEPVLDKIRAEVIAKYPKNYAGEPELGGCACEFSLNQILQIIDKYKAETESEE